MAKKKLQYPHRRRNIVIGSLITAGVVAVLSGSLYLNYLRNKEAQSYVATIDGDRVGIEKYKLNLFNEQIGASQYGEDIWNMDIGGMTYGQYAFGAAYDNTIVNEISRIKAQELGVAVLSEEQTTSVDSMMETFNINYGQDVIDYLGVTEDGLRQMLSEGFYTDNVYAKVTEDGYVLDEEAFEAAFETYYEAEENALARYSYYYIATDTEEAMQEVLDKYEDGEDFAELMAEYSVDYAPPASEGEIAESSTGGELTEEETTEEETTEEETTEEESTEEDTTEEETTEEETTEEETTEEETTEEETTEEESTEEDTTEEETTEGTTGAASEEDENEETPAEGVQTTIDLSGLEVDMNKVTQYGSELMTEMSDQIYGMEAGDITEVIPLWNDDRTEYSQWVVVQLLEVVEPVKEDEKQKYKDGTYIPENKDLYYQEQVRVWIEEEHEVVMNEKAIQAVRMFGQQ